MDKLRIVDSDWDKIPADVEEVGVDQKGNITYYKNIKENSYEYKMPDESWTSSRFTPVCKERIKRPSNIFTKSMLVAGKHIVETGEGNNNTYLITILDNGYVILENSSGHLNLDEYNEDLTLLDGDNGDDEFDIVKIYTRSSPKKIESNLIWERTPVKVPTQKELQLVALQDTINKAQEQIESLMKD